MKNISHNYYLKYLQVYEDFNKDIPDDLKLVFSNVRNLIGIQNQSFTKSINLNELNFTDLVLNIDVIFIPIKNDKSYHNKDIIYYSNINIFDLLNGDEIVNIPIKIVDVKINQDKLISIISHEIRHIYDILTINEESDMDSFVSSLYYNKLKENKSNKEFSCFLDLIYLSLEHELIARNTMIYENFINCKCNKNELYKHFNETYIYKSLVMLKDYDPIKVINIDNIMNKTNNFISYFGGNECKNKQDIDNFYNNWTNYFKLKSDEYLKESYKVLDDIHSVNETNITKTKRIFKVKDILKMIYEEHIK